jgi:hypothetical protein
MVITMPCVPGWKPNERRKGHRHGHHAAVCTCTCIAIHDHDSLHASAESRMCPNLQIGLNLRVTLNGNGLTDRVVNAHYLSLREVRVRIPRDSLFICGFGRSDQGGKTPSSVLQLKHRSVTNLSHGAAVPLCIGEVGVRGFSRSV